MPGFGFPANVAGGAGPGGTALVMGGSGASYPNFTAAFVGETSEGRSDFTPQPGTSAGVLVLSASSIPPGPVAPTSTVDEFYDNFWVVNTDPSPSNGMAGRYARVTNYDGATLTCTLDQPWNFVNEASVAIIRPVRMWLLGDIVESFAITRNVEIDFGGHRVTGGIDVDFQSFIWLRGSGGYISNGITWQSDGVLIIDDLTVSRRNTDIYALVVTNFSNDVGRCVVRNSVFWGCVSNRRGWFGWEIVNCRCVGFAETDRNVPYRLFESVPGVTVDVFNADVFINSEFAGAIFYSEDSITGTPYVNVEATITVPNGTANNISLLQQPVSFFVFWTVDAGVTTMTPAANSTVLVTQLNNVFRQTTVNDSPCGLSVFTNCTGTSVLTLTNLIVQYQIPGSQAQICEIAVLGTATCSGSMTITGGVFRCNSESNANYIAVYLCSLLTGTVVAGSTIRNLWAVNVNTVTSRVAQNSGAPSVTVSGTVSGTTVGNYSVWTFGAAVTVGTWTVSATLNGSMQSVGSWSNSLPAAVAGGTFVASGAITLSFLAGAATSGLTLAAHLGTGGTYTVSGAVIVTGFAMAAMTLASCTGAGATLNVTSATIALRGFRASAASTFITATTATSTVTVTGSVQFEDFKWDAAVTVFNATAGGGVAQAPATMTFYNCAWTSTFTDRSGAGTLTLAAASWRFRNCVFDGLVTITGTSFTAFEAFETSFNGNSGNRSITCGGTRPTTFRFWKCQFRSLISNQPDVIDDYSVWVANAALTAGNIVTIDATGNVINAAAGTTVVEGVLLITTGGIGEPAVLVRRGQMFVATVAGVVLGDQLINDAAGVPTSQIAGAPVVGRRTGRALENVGATTPGLCYTLLDLR